MADYTGTTWVDDNGTGTTGTVGTAARMNAMEAGIKDAAEHNRLGAFTSMPTAAAANKGWFWIATDTDSLGGLYRSDGAAWVKMPSPLPRSGVFGDGSDGAWTALTTPTNVLANPGAETNTTGWSQFFLGGGVGSGPTRVADAGAGSGSFAFEVGVTGATGAGVLLLYPGGASSFVGSAVNVVAGQVVDFSADVKAQAGTFTSIKLLTRWYDSGGFLLAGVGEVDVTGAIQNAPTVGTWYSISGSATAPTGAAYAGVEPIGSFAGAGTYTLRADNIAARPLMPGSTRLGSTYTLTRDVYYTNLTVNTGVTINENGYRIYANGVLSGAGTISNNGAAGSGRFAGLGAQGASIGPGWSGGNGGNGAANGSASGAIPRYGHGGRGGGGGAGTGGFTGGSFTSPTLPTGGVRRALPELASCLFYENSGSSVEQIGGGGGGGGGGGATGGTGGGGGGGGGVVAVLARVLSGTVSFQAQGGAGANGTTNGGGGGGGGGGAIHVVCATSGWTGTTSVTGGAAGAGNGTGASGVAGAAGTAIVVAV